jgi:hypothetical protein
VDLEERRESHLAAVKRWHARNPEKRRAHHRNWRQREKNRIGFELRKTIWQALKHRDSGRDWRSDCRLAEIIGCSKPDLIAHIAARFLPGMSWSNYGRIGWEIDHIKPCASFDLTQHEQVRACFHYTNLRPLWRADNLRKSRKDGAFWQ